MCRVYRSALSPDSAIILKTRATSYICLHFRPDRREPSSVEEAAILTAVTFSYFQLVNVALGVKTKHISLELIHIQEDYLTNALVTFGTLCPSTYRSVKQHVIKRLTRTCSSASSLGSSVVYGRYSRLRTIASTFLTSR